jgi:hypothetical protein
MVILKTTWHFGGHKKDTLYLWCVTWITMSKILPLDVGTHDCTRGRSLEILGGGAELYIYIVPVYVRSLLK